MVHTGNQYALDTRDSLVNRARESDPVLQAYYSGQRVKAALLDFAENLFLGAVPSTLSGLAVVTSYPIIAYRGWIGGIVSVNDLHVSRLSTTYGAFYYLVTLFLQLVPYSLAGGAGVNLGVAYLRPPKHYRGDKVLGLPKEAILDTLRIYTLVTPLFLVASLFEFLA